uniref:FH2 domain-containing protein n=1 Tax=Rhabditophanes sp. KR3021 TaxID=114890 RepID=A0AC35TPJ0_9BILA
MAPINSLTFFKKTTTADKQSKLLKKTIDKEKKRSQLISQYIKDFKQKSNSSDRSDSFLKEFVGDFKKYVEESEAKEAREELAEAMNDVKL